MSAEARRPKCAFATEHPLVTRVLLLVALIPLLAVPSAEAAEFVKLWGPVTFQRTTTSPVVQTETFSGFPTDREYELRIASNGVSSAVVLLNGEQIFGTRDFNPKVTTLTRRVVLAAQNQLSVELRGTPGESLIIALWGAQTTDLSIDATASPAANAAGWRAGEVVVAFQCTSTLSRVAFCPPPVSVSTEGAGQVVTGEARDEWGNTASVSITLNIDRSAPQIVITAPASGATVRTPTVAVSGTIADAISSVQSVSCNGGPASISGNTFTCAVPFDDGARSVEVTATDVAGNVASSTVSFGVLTTPQVTITAPADLTFLNISPITVLGTVSDPDATVRVNGIEAATAGGTFSVTVPLVEGNNTLSAVARTAAGKIGTSSLQVTLDTTPPRLAITSPVEGFETVESTIAVAGTVNDIVVGTVNDEQARVTVNGIPAAVSNRSFLVPDVPLQPGPNAIQIVGRDRVGNSFTTSVTAIRLATPQTAIRVAGGNYQTAGIGTMLGTPLTVRVTGAGGAPAVDVPVVFKVTEGNGLINDASTVAPWIVTRTNATGHAQVSYRLGSRAGAGNNKVQATATGYEGTASFVASATAGEPAHINVDAGVGQTGAIGTRLAFPFVAVVTDAGHNRLSGVPVTFTVTRGGGTIDGQETISTSTDSDGRALAVLTLGLEAGYDNQAVEASFPGQSGNPAAFVASARTPCAEALTQVSGVVLDNSNQPLPGATVRLYQFYLGSNSNVPLPVTPEVTTDANGQFVITGAPIGKFKLLADGTTIPGPNRYPTLEFDIVTVAGQNITLGLPVYLPALDTVNRLCVNESTGGTLTLPSVPGFSFTVEPGAATFPGGARSGCVTVTAVNGDKVPMVPGFGQQPRFVITVQPVGTHFNPPAQISFPNVDGLQPREVTEMYSYDHDLSTFVAIGTATVSNDGSVMRSDPGVGVIKAGWHCGGNPNPTGSAATCPDCKKCQGTNCVPDPAKTGTLDANRCCFEGAPLPKKGNKFDVLIAKCPQRTQNDTNHIVDGCSVPGLLALITPGLSVQDPVGGSLGHTGTAFGQVEGTLPAGQPALGLPCNQHDICYQTCKSVQGNCDNGMLSRMLGVCQAAYPESNCPFTGLKILACPFWYEEKADCIQWAAIYKLGLDKFGSTAWKERQEQFCDCCP